MRPLAPILPLLGIFASLPWAVVGVTFEWDNISTLTLYIGQNFTLAWKEVLPHSTLYMIRKIPRPSGDFGAAVYEENYSIASIATTAKRAVVLGATATSITFVIPELPLGTYVFQIDVGSVQDTSGNRTSEFLLGAAKPVNLPSLPNASSTTTTSTGSFTTTTHVDSTRTDGSTETQSTSGAAVGASTPAANTSSNPPAAEGGRIDLSTAEKAGIGVGVGIFAVAVLFLLGGIFFRLSRRKPPDDAPSQTTGATHHHDAKFELVGSPAQHSWGPDAGAASTMGTPSELWSPQGLHELASPPPGAGGGQRGRFSGPSPDLSWEPRRDARRTQEFGYAWS